jgi:hypothetical protein
MLQKGTSWDGKLRLGINRFWVENACGERVSGQSRWFWYHQDAQNWVRRQRIVLIALLHRSDQFIAIE